MPSNETINDVSDTALWVAAYRAAESARPNAAFHDPLAAVLIGDRGDRLRQSMPHMKMMQWVMVIRTIAIDRLVESAVRGGVDTIINIGAGMDTRPYRLSLPADLRWIELDFANIINLKEQRLKTYTPNCTLERGVCDILDRNLRNRMLANITACAQSVAILTEGLIPYLTSSDVALLAQDLLDVPNVKYWIQDYYAGNVRHMGPRAWRNHLRAAPFKFDVPNWLEFFAMHHWQALEKISLVEEAARLGRHPPLPWWRMLLYALTPAKKRAQMRERIGYAMFEPAPITPNNGRNNIGNYGT